MLRRAPGARVVMSLLMLCCSVGAAAVSAQLPEQVMTPAPQRIVSINLCTDELLLEVAAPETIVALSHLVRDPDLTWYASAASTLPVTRPQVEALLALQPDLVVAGRYSAPATVTMLRQLGHTVALFDLPRSVEQIQVQIEQMGELLHRQDRARAVLSRMNNELQGVAQPGQPVKALLYRPNGLTADAGSLAHDVMRRAGLVNLALDAGVPAYGRVSLERVVMLAPELLVFDDHGARSASLAQQLLAHPALQEGAGSWATAAVPAQAWTCGSPGTVRAIAMLAAAARRVAGGSDG